MPSPAYLADAAGVTSLVQQRGHVPVPRRWPLRRSRRHLWAAISVEDVLVGRRGL